MNDGIKASNLNLLTLLLGKRAAKKWYRGSLEELYLGEHLPEDARMRMAASRELVRRWMAEELRHGPLLDCPSSVRDYLLVHFAGYEREVFLALFLDNRHRLVSCDELFLGTIDGASVHPREVVKQALRHNAAAVILAHNHPSGVAEASQADELITLRLKDALALVDIRVLDHLIVGGRKVASLAGKGVI